LTTLAHLPLAAPLLLATTPATAAHPGAGTRPGVTATSTPKKAVEAQFARGLDMISGVVRVR
jgi:hypothetical protein